MRKVNIHQAKTNLSRLLEEVGEGAEIIIARAGKPVARLVPVQKTGKRRKLGVLSGKFTVPSDFDAPLPENAIEEFEGKRGTAAR